MNRCLATISMSALSVGMLVAGCQKPADQQSGPDANSSPSLAEAAKSAVKNAIEPKPLVVPADTVIAVVLDQTISSKPSNIPLKSRERWPSRRALAQRES